MKQFQKLVASASIMTVFCLFACKNEQKVPEKANSKNKIDAPKGEMTVASTDGQTYVLNAGSVTWVGSMAVGGKKHDGSIPVSGGQFFVKEGKLVGGSVDLDIAGMTNNDLPDDQKGKLVGHLKSPDFFDAAKFPKARFEIKEILSSSVPDFNSVILGELELKGIKKEVNIPTKLKIENGELVAESATFGIDRTQWGINFKSSAIEKMKDKIINEQVLLALRVTAKAQ